MTAEEDHERQATFRRQITYALRQAESGKPVAELCRQLGDGLFARLGSSCRHMEQSWRKYIRNPLYKFKRDKFVHARIDGASQRSGYQLHNVQCSVPRRDLPFMSWIAYQGCFLGQ